MELPRTSPSGRNPASRTSRNSLTDRSLVNRDPGEPGRSSARRAIASAGTPWATGSVILLQPHDRERAGRMVGGAELGDRGTDEGRLDDVVVLLVVVGALA